MFLTVVRLHMPSLALRRSIPKTAVTGRGYEEFLDDLGSANILDATQILVFRRAIIAVNERLPALEEDDEEHRSRCPVPPDSRHPRQLTLNEIS